MPQTAPFCASARQRSHAMLTRTAVRVTCAAMVAALTAFTGAGLTVVAGPAQAAAQHVYYVSPSGNDANSGTSASAPWRTLGKANSVVLAPGDQVLLARGGHWTGVLLPSGSGTSASPITIGAYGSGALPLVTGGANGDCVRLAGSYIHVDSVAATGCSYSGFHVAGNHDSVTGSQAWTLKIGIHIGTGSSFGSFQYNVLTNINLMEVNTQGTHCGTPTAKNCNDDSGATAFLINGNDNDIGFNTVTGSNAYSYDYGRDGSAFEIFDANRNVIHDNTSRDNLVLSELGRNSTGSADGNQFLRNVVTASCGANCFYAGGVILRGAGSSFGPNLATVIDANTFNLVGGDTKGVVCGSNCPSSTVVTNNTMQVATRALWMDGSGWTLHGNVIYGATVAQAGSVKRTVPAGASIIW